MNDSHMIFVHQFKYIYTELYVIMIMIDISITFRETNSNGSENQCLGPMYEMSKIGSRAICTTEVLVLGSVIPLASQITNKFRYLKWRCSPM